MTRQPPIIIPDINAANLQNFAMTVSFSNGLPVHLCNIRATRGAARTIKFERFLPRRMTRQPDPAIGHRLRSFVASTRIVIQTTNGRTPRKALARFATNIGPAYPWIHRQPLIAIPDRRATYFQIFVMIDLLWVRLPLRIRNGCARLKK